MAAIVAAEGHGIAKEEVSPPDDSKYVAHNLTMQLLVSMAIKAFIELGIPDILSNAKEPMTAEEIVSRLPNKSGRGSAGNLTRVLRPLVREGVIGESLNEESTRVYSLTKISRWFITDNEFTIVPAAGLYFTKQFLSSHTHWKESILDNDVVPFDLENGAPFFDYIEKDVELRTKLQHGMSRVTEVPQVVGQLQESGALDGVKTLIDLGGGRMGAVVGLVVAQNPHIHGINFDRPSVIATSPPVQDDLQHYVEQHYDQSRVLSASGVEHVAGDFLGSVPSADAIFMKFILHGYGDEECLQILKNCFKALPSTGKVIVAEYVLSDSKEYSPVGRFTEFMDLFMLSIVGRGKERTKQEYQKLLEAAGFSNVNLLSNPEGMGLILAIKD